MSGCSFHDIHHVVMATCVFVGVAVGVSSGCGLQLTGPYDQIRDPAYLSCSQSKQLVTSVACSLRKFEKLLLSVIFSQMMQRKIIATVTEVISFEKSCVKNTT